MAAASISPDRNGTVDHLVTIVRVQGQEYLLDPAFQCRPVTRALPLVDHQHEDGYRTQLHSMSVVLTHEGSHLYRVDLNNRAIYKRDFYRLY
jgi:hypothetical protein